MDKISVVIVTFQRPVELRDCIDSINQQTYLPFEIIVIDNDPSNNGSAEKVCIGLSSVIPVHYFKNSINSLPIARNMGVARSKGEYILMVDDDVQISNNYVENIIKIFKENSQIVGVQGYIHQQKRPMVRELLHRIFGHYHLEINKCRVMKSISTTYPYKLNKNISCEWISGSNQVYRKEVLNEILWDEKLMKYADGEDLDHSYRVFRNYPNRLLITPHASVFHPEAITGRTIKKELIVMREVYGWYLNNKLFPSSREAKIRFIWSRIGRLIFCLLMLAKNRDRDSKEILKNLIWSYCFVWKNQIMFSSGEFEKFPR